MHAFTNSCGFMFDALKLGCAQMAEVPVADQRFPGTKTDEIDQADGVPLMRLFS
jgi:hypothetical protein